MNPLSLILAVAIIGGIAAVIFITNSRKEEPSAALQEQGAPRSQVQEEAGQDMAQPERIMEDRPAGSYEPYAPEKVSFANEGRVVLFFKAQWCSTCSVLDKNIIENVANIPEDVKVLTVDFDTETELKRKYGVTLQHTLVQVDANGDMIQKWSGGGTLESILAKL